MPPVLGIRREDKNKWERRVPLSPSHVSQLVGSGVRVLIQPSTIRVYPDAAYREAGAEVTEDLSPAGTILAVKEVPAGLLLPGRTYAFFSHTIKGQAGNMPLLDELLARRVRLVDYEAITAGGVRGGRRLVAFGRFAGIAGMIDFLRGLGERYLGLGFSTPFLNIASTYTYPSLAAAYDAVRVCGEAIRRYGLPAALCPLTFVVTGDGNVSKGAQEVLSLLGGALAWVAPGELEAIVRAGPGDGRTVYGAVAREEHMVAPRAPGAAAAAAADFEIGEEESAGAGASGSFDKAAYRASPEAFEPVFHTRVLPFTSVLVNCMYWEPRFPRLVSIAQAQAAAAAGTLRLQGVCDITCDFAGSVEFLKEFTSIDSPFYLYNVERDEVLRGNMEAPGVLYHAVDHLPSECPRDASDHFGACLLPLLPALLASDAALPFDRQEDLPPELRGAVICAGGELTPSFSYIRDLRAANERAAASRGLRRSRVESFLTMELQGHLFDSGIINQILDLLEDASASSQILDVKMGKDRSTPTTMRVQIFSADPAGAQLSDVFARIRALAVTQGVALELSGDGSTSPRAPAGGSLAVSVPRTLPPAGAPAAGGGKRVLVLGAGFVSGPVLEFLLRAPGTRVTVASLLVAEATALVARVATAPSAAARCAAVQLDVARDASRLESLIREADLVISLVNAPFHPAIARVAIAARVHMVTASYVSPEMRALSAAAAEAGVAVLSEAGLDPGIDHMSAMRMIDAARAEGAVVVGFSSTCGGLPAPEAANNPLGYKFSWSPRGALGAARNAARYLRAGAVVEVAPDALLTSAARLRVNPAFALEVLPNRDALPYAELYGIAGPALRDMFRGTLRYGGFAAHMHALAALGLLDAEPPRALPPGVRGAPSMRELLAAHAGAPAGAAASDEELVAAALRTVSASTAGAVGGTFAALSASASSLAGLAAAALAAASGAVLGTDVARAGELRDFLAWLGLLSSAPAPFASAPGAPPPAAAGTYSPLDTLTAMLTALPEMSYAPGERDMALMRHELTLELPGGRRERRTGTLIQYAQGGHTAMARTVGYTAAAAAQLLLQGAVPHAGGVIVPTTREWYEPILNMLEAEGITMREEVEKV